MTSLSPQPGSLDGFGGQVPIKCAHPIAPHNMTKVPLWQFTGAEEYVHELGVPVVGAFAVHHTPFVSIPGPSTSSDQAVPQACQLC